MRLSSGLTAAGLCAPLCAPAIAQPLVIPAAYSTVGSSIAPSDTLTREFPRVHQQVISASQLSEIPVGASITQITMRPSNANSANALGSWPPADLTFATYEIYLAKAARSPGNMSTTFTDNIVAGTEVRVRSGPLTIFAGSYDNFVALPGANPWGMVFQVTPFVYTGGDLVITVRHSGHQTPGTPRLFIDSLSNPSGSPISEQCMAAASMSATTGAPDQSLPAILRVRWTTPSNCYANCDHSTTTPFLNVNDYLCFLNQFANGLALPAAQQAGAWANCDGSTVQPALNIADFVCFNNKFAVGCPNP
jgi:hypothetical protein